MFNAEHVLIDDEVSCSVQQSSGVPVDSGSDVPAEAIREFNIDEDSDVIAVAVEPEVQHEDAKPKTPCYMLKDLQLLPKPFAICTQDMAETYKKHVEGLMSTASEDLLARCEADLASLRDMVWCDETGFFAGANALAKGKYRSIKANFFKKFELVA